MSRRKSRLAARLPYPSTAALVADVGKYRLGGPSLWDDRDDEPRTEGGDVSLHSLIAQGGKVVVVGSWNKAWQSYRSHPQLVFWSGDAAEISRAVREAGNRLPSNTRGLVLSRFLGHDVARHLLADARAKRVMIMNGKNDGEIERILAEVTHSEPPDMPADPPTNGHAVAPPAVAAPVVPLPGINEAKAPVLSFVLRNVRADGSPHVSEGRRLLPLAEAAGLKTTEGSLTQAVYKARKMLGLSKIQASVSPKPEPPAAPLALEPEPVAAAVPIPPVVAEPASSPAPGTPAKAALLALADEALKSLATATAAVQLLQQGVLAMADETEQYHELRQRLAALLGK